MKLNLTTNPSPVLIRKSLVLTVAVLSLVYDVAKPWKPKLHIKYNPWTFKEKKNILSLIFSKCSHFDMFIANSVTWWIDVYWLQC
jgi:hypothetical protein